MKYSEIAYRRPDMATFSNDFEHLLTSFSATSEFNEQVELIGRINAMRAEFETNLVVADINYSRDTTNKNYDKEKAFFNAEEPGYRALVNRYYKALLASPLRPELENHFGKQLFVIASLKLKTVNESVLEELQQENALKSAYMKLRAGAKIPFQGEEHNLASINPLLQSPDREVRFAASKAVNAFMEANGDEFDRIYDEQVKLRHTIAQKLGFKNGVELAYARLCRSDYDPKMVAKYRKQVVEEVVPFVNKLREDQAKRLGVDTFYAHDVPVLFADGNPTPKGDEAWIMNHASTMYKELSPETDVFFQHMIQNEMLDLSNRKGKAGGGFCDFLPNVPSPYIFSNFNGTSHDLTVLTHEAGHAFQVYQSRKIGLPEYFWPTFDAAEIHSMAMEFITWPWMGKFFKEDLTKFCYEHVCKLLFFLPYGVMVDEFQHYVYENPEHTPAKRKKHWMKLEKKYRPFMQYDGDFHAGNGGVWQLQGHLYQEPFYYIDYTLAGVCALQFWKKSTEDASGAWQDYLNLCKKGGSLSFLGLVDSAGLKSPFEDGTLKTVVAHAKRYLEENEVA